MKKRIISCLFASAIMMSLGTASAFAAEKATSSTPLGSPKANFSFVLYAGDDSSMSDAAQKTDSTPAGVYPKSGNIPSGNSVLFRVRDDNGRPATALTTRSNLSSFTMSYLKGYNTVGWKQLYASAPSANQASVVSVGGVWYP